MDASTLDELRTLRARAYGPAADIDQDPAALRRLRELEARGSAPARAPEAVAATGASTAAVATAAAVTTGPAVTGAAPAAAAPAPPAVTVPASATDPTVPHSVAPDVATPPRRSAARRASVDPTAHADLTATTDSAASETARPRRTRRLSSRAWALWALTVVAVAALAAGLTYSLTAVPPVTTANGATQIDTLDPDPFAQVPTGWFGAGPSSLAFEYYGLTLFETAGGYIGVGTDCFSMAPTEQLPEQDADANSWSMSGMMLSGCRAGAFPATIQFVIDSNAPQELRDRFPPESAIQFVFDGDRIGVFLAAPDEP